MIDFSKRIKNGVHAKKTHPIDIYNSLDRASVTGPLRPAQANVLQKWFDELRDRKDLIIKLHTGAGKTLVGLLIAMSYLNSNEGPAIYVCPNIYLAQQVCSDAQKFGVPFCVVNRNNEIPVEFLQGKSLLVTHVQKVFNGLSIFGTGNRSTQVGCIILDDSHACIDSMLGSCTIQILRETDAYSKLLNLFQGDLEEQGKGTLQDLLNNRTGSLMPIPYWAWQSKIDEVTRIIASNTDDNHVKFAWPIIKDQLEDCKAFISNNKIEISPLCMPIQEYGIFNNAKHRILMSATTQEDTFFIKGLGLSTEAVSSPLTDERYLWSGEKMILIPDAICENVNGDELIDTIISSPHEYGIAILTPSFDKARRYVSLGAKLVNDPEASGSMYQTLRDHLGHYQNQTIVFANRYDGIDLPDDSCRILIIDSVPYYDSLSDRYEELCRSESEIIRIKTVQKIEQGLGRSVRGEKDYSVILIFGSDLIKYIRTITNRTLFSAQTQKQIEIGFDIVEMAKEEGTPKDPSSEVKLLLSTITQCLSRDEGWKMYYSSMMDEIGQIKTDKSALYTVLQKERAVYNEVLLRNYDAAAKLLQEIVDVSTEITEKGWYLQEKAKLLYHISHQEANTVQVSAFKKNNQLLKPQSGIVYNKIKYPLDYSRNMRIIQELSKNSTYDELSIYLEDLLQKMSFGVAAEKAEDAFYKIGQMLGFESQRPDKEIRKGPDVLWCVSDNKYVLIECKTEVVQDRQSISKSEAGQMEEHCAWFETEYGAADITPVMVIPTSRLAHDAYFSHNVGILLHENLQRFKNQVRDFFKEFKQYSLYSINPDLVNQKLIAHNLYDDSFFESFLVPPKKSTK